MSGYNFCRTGNFISDNDPYYIDIVCKQCPPDTEYKVAVFRGLYQEAGSIDKTKCCEDEAYIIDVQGKNFMYSDKAGCTFSNI